MKNVPKLRFREFEGVWKSMPISKMVKLNSDKYDSSKTAECVKCIELEHISSGTGEILGYSEGTDFGSIKNRFQKGDVLYGKLRPYLRKFAKPDFSGVCSSEIWVLKSDILESGFLFQIVQAKTFSELANISSGSKMPRGDWKTVSSGSLFVCESKEQTKIAQFLTSIDDRLSSLRKKKALLEEYKKGMMQKIFSREVRFRDDDGSEFPEWEKVKLENLGSAYSGLSGKSGNDFGQGQPYIQYRQVFGNSSISLEQCGLVQVNAGENQQQVRYGDIFFTISSETPTEVGLTSVMITEVILPTYLNSFCFGFRPFNLEEIIPQFSRYLFRSFDFRKSIVELAQGSTRYNISKNQVLKIDFLLPNKKEQTKIAQFLTALDDKIAQTAAQIEKTGVFKKGLLAEMFV